MLRFVLGAFAALAITACATVEEDMAATDDGKTCTYEQDTGSRMPTKVCR